MKVIEKALAVLRTEEFVVFATADKNAKPNSAPKLLLKIEGRKAYFIDYSIGKSYENLKVNPEVSLSCIDFDSLFGYRLNGSVEIIENGDVFEECLREFTSRRIQLSVERVVRGVQDGKAHKGFELDIPERFLVYVVNVGEGCEISPHGSIERENDVS